MARKLTPEGNWIEENAEPTRLEWPKTTPRHWVWDKRTENPPASPGPAPIHAEAGVPGGPQVEPPSFVNNLPAQPAAPAQPAYGPRPPADITGTVEMAGAFAGGPGPIKLPSGGEVTLSAEGAGRLLSHPWTSSAIIDPEGFAKRHPAEAKMFTDPKTGELDINAIRNFEIRVEGKMEAEKKAAEQKQMIMAAQGRGGKGATMPGPPQPDFSLAGRKSFEKTVFQQLGGNPFTFNPSEAVKDSSRFLPDLFNAVFQGTVTWEDRGKLNEQEEAAWQTELKRFRAEVHNQAIQKNELNKRRYQGIMEQWDAAAGRTMLSKEAKIEQEKQAIRQPFEIAREERKKGAAEMSPGAFGKSRSDLEKQINITVFKGKPLATEEDRKLSAAYMKTFDNLRKDVEAGRIDLSPSDLAQRSVDQVNAILDAYWKDYNTHKNDKESVKYISDKVKGMIGYVPVTPR